MESNVGNEFKPAASGTRQRFALAAILLFSPAVKPASAQPPASSSSTITLQQILALVERDNPDIAAARARWEAAQKRVVQAGTPDKPRLDLERMYAPSNQNVISGAVERNIAVTQETPFPTTLYLRHKTAGQEAQIAEQAYDAKIREVSAKAEQTYAALFLAYRALDIFNENVEIMRRFSKVAESRYAAGHSSQLDALKAQVELTRMLNMVVTVEQEKGTDAAMLNALLNRDAGQPLALPADPNPGDLGLQLDRLEAEALSGRPELRQAALEARKAATELSLAKSEFLPDLMLQYRYRNDPTMGNSNDAVIGFSLPLWFWKPAAMVSQAKAEKATAEAELQAMRVGTSADLKTAWLRAQTAMRLANIYQTSLLPQAGEALSVAESGYQSGDNSFLDLLDAQRSLLNYRLEYFQDLSEYEQRLAELERIVGRELRAP
jgi:outer membrane protein TolC